MDFLKNNNRFSFLYGGEDIFSHNFTKSVEEKGNELTTTYLFDDGLKVTNIAKKYPEYDAYEWVNYFENTGDKDTKLISQLWDASCDVKIGAADKFEWVAKFPDIDDLTRIYNPRGSDCSAEDFSTDIRWLHENIYQNAFYLDDKKYYTSDEARSSGGKSAPFFNIENKGQGVIVAIGWTGQWECELLRKEESVEIKSGIKNTEFVLYPNEKIRTSSVVIMSYKGDYFDAQNKWRRLVKAEFSPVTSINEVPFCSGIWGGMESKKAIEKIEAVNKYEIPVEYFWMDAGWYGGNTKPTPDEFEGDWPEYTGDWRISPLIHPNGMLDITKKIKECNKKFLLWFEPERVRKQVPIAKEHPEYFMKYENEDNLHLNLGIPEAFDYCLETLSEIIEKLDIKCYRQDFNFDPQEFWRAEDEPNRHGITEIKHINGLYKLWDSLIERFPGLVIDNCASGGRRIDIETMRRSIPLWRSDVQCPANYTPEFSQLHQMNFSLWMPYSGTGTGRVCENYNFRSAYAAGLTCNLTFSAKDSYCDDEKIMLWYKERAEEYLKVRKYFDGDIYHLTEPSRSLTEWNGVQWNRPEEKDGMVQVFKHKRSPYQTAGFMLRGIDESKNYLITDIDGGEFEVSGKDLAENGFSVTVEEQQVAKIYLYKQI